jgi:sigma-B regulation protein RsbU (phosphoserine phosphatase)
MKKSKLIRLKNEMLVANFLANFVGVFFGNVMFIVAEGYPDEQIWQQPLPYWIDTLFTPFAFFFVCVMTLLYEQPIRRYLNLSFKMASISEELAARARRRLLNEPFVLIVLSFSMWLLASTIYPIIHWIYGSGLNMVQRALFNSLITGVITITIAFFLLEHTLQKRLAPEFFPNGGLTAIPRTLRIRIRTRLMALLFACNLIPLISIMLILQRVTNIQQDLSTAMQHLRSAIFTNSFIFVGVGIFLTILIGRNLSIPFKEIVQTLNWVKNGRFDKKIRVTSNDEIGYTGDVINEMTDGLIERERMQQSLNLAREVQQNLLPKINLRVKGFDIAGKSVYCDETGGDYYDFITIKYNDKQKIGVAIGDVSGHGISSALLMATVRSSLRQRASLPGSIANIISDVNRQLVQDVEDSGQFMTLFFLALTTESRKLEWVRAGHDPAIIYDPGTDSFDELSGSGIALGVDGGWIYEANKKADLSDDQIIFLSTDGIWEARNKKGEMLGKEPILNAIRQNSSLDSTQIIDAIFDALDKFIGEAKIDDDITSVIIKMQH